ncbi:M56 family metallopeptidase, partial [Paenibacillus sp. N3.4]|uniref:M56 family metallopeptidase n=1 Tax=Paenibacillus sp. N3.4 TaxID=2603222 RepID=UPI0011C9E15B
MNMICNIFLWFLYSTFAASVVALLVMAIQKLFHRFLSARIQHALWLIVCIRLLIPVFPNSDISIFNMLPLVTDLKSAVSIIPFTQNHTSRELLQSNQENDEIHKDFNMGSLDHNIEQNLSAKGTEDQVTAPLVTYSTGLKIVSTVWFLGMVAILIYFIFCMFKMRRRFSSLRVVADSSILKSMDDCRVKFDIKRPISVYTGNYAISPYISGLMRPWIYFPEAIGKELSATQIFHVFSHELAHFKRRDIAWNMIGSFILAIHWMNPFIWMCIRKMKADRELACDAYVLEILGEAEAVAYGMTIIEFLKRLSAKRYQPSSLYFYESSNHNQLARRLRMIKSFKKGSYKLTVIAVLCMAIIATVTLTNSRKPMMASSTEILPAVTETAVKDRILFDSSFRSYNNLEKAAKVADFKFKVPDFLPEGYKFESVSLKPKEAVDNKLSKVMVYFQELRGNINYGNFELDAVYGGTLEAAYADIEQYEKRGTDSELVIKKEPLNNQLWDALKVTVGTGKKEKVIYVWLDNDIQYQIKGNGNLSNQEFLTMISSMKYPDDRIKDRYENPNMLNVRIYDVDDLQRVPDSIGFTPRFPLQALGRFQAVTAYVSQKMDFSYPVDDVDRRIRLLSIGYQKMDNSHTNIKSFDFMQIKNGNTYQDIKENGYVNFYRIDGQKNKVKASPMEIGGTEVFKTEKYKIDGPLSDANEADLVSYF